MKKITKYVIITILCFGIVYTIARSLNVLPKDPTSNIHDKLGKILKTCFAEQLTALVVSNDLSEAAHEMSGDKINIPIILIGRNFENQRGHRNMPRWPTFLLSANTGLELTTVLQQLKSTAYWNIYATFFIVGNTKDSCQKAPDILYSAWKMNLVSVFYVCDSQSQGASLYTSNPFTDRAPKSWKKVKNDGRWTLYVRRNLKENFCVGMNWDKTEFLDGYEVKAVANVKAGETYEQGKVYGVDSMSTKQYPIDSKIFINVWKKMNVTVNLHYDQPGFFKNGTAVGFLPKLIDGTYDIAPVTRELTFNSTPHITELSFVIVTRHRNFLRPEEKILNFYTTSIIILILAVLLTTWLVFVLANRGQIISAALEVLRMIITTGLLQPLDRTSMRIYLFGVLWLLLILSGTFQGNLSAFLTKPERHDVDTWENLESLNYRLYLPIGYDFLASAPQLKTIKSKGNMRTVPGIDCIDHILNDSLGACLQNKLRSIQPATKYDLHLGKDILILPCAYWQRTDWPLSMRTNVYLSRLIQSGLVETWRKDTEDSAKLTSHEAQAVLPRIRKIKLDDLVFAYKFLAFGLSLSLVVFLIELGWKQRRQIALKLVQLIHITCQYFRRGIQNLLLWFQKLKFWK